MTGRLPIVVALGAGLVACSPNQSVTCVAVPARATILSCRDAADRAMTFGEHHGVRSDTAKVRFSPTYGISEGVGVRSWIVTIRTRPLYQVVVRADTGEVLAYTGPRSKPGDHRPSRRDW
jgi:hypothetical protein